MNKKNRFITGYGGLRALAVIGVILYHLNPNQFMGVYLGVPIFLVLSGYLVTDQHGSVEKRGGQDQRTEHQDGDHRVYGCAGYVCISVFAETFYLRDHAWIRQGMIETLSR